MCGDVVWSVSRGCQERVGRLSRECGEAVWMVWEGYLEDVGRLSGGVGRLSSGCRKSI